MDFREFFAESKIVDLEQTAENRINNPLSGTFVFRNFDNSKGANDGADLSGTSLNCFTPQSEVRKYFFGLVISKNFERAIIVIILLSSIQLALSNPLVNPNSNL